MSAAVPRQLGCSCTASQFGLRRSANQRIDVCRSLAKSSSDFVRARSLYPRAATQLSRAKPWLTVESSFAEAAERYSMGTPDVQVFATDDMQEVLVPPLGAVVNGLEEGDVSPLVEAYTGTYHVVQLVSRSVAVRRPLDEVQGDITDVLTRERREEHRRAWVAARLAEADVETSLSITVR